ncbi:MAG: radical SAM protein [Candidatus Woesearchaeota archaeon]|jgi:radical SAM superfamily enzyme YgiQ (UPF0313 family)|nr:radical SAM protein [Candidatus Woesearchaeota archaeon]MDP7505951.1 radical SAM protein [Candidatus Woesearchaeota archaeon]MDP7610223.1 radical SAM protein [Candidatus Woesearchaeota archaeon]|tara:strand:- start:9700 stop:11463 length:1764 start_codon:yes stop_codon:yes gene_type:complete
MVIEIDSKYEEKKATIVGIMPRLPEHSKQSVFGKVRMFSIGLDSVLSQIEGHDVYIVDENNYKGPIDADGLPDYYELGNRRHAIISMIYGGMSILAPRLYSIAKENQKRGIVTVAGGKHVENMPLEALASGVDIVVHGEGEKAAQEISSAIIRYGKVVEGYKKNLEQILGISFLREDGEYRFTGEREPMTVEELDGLKDPNMKLIKYMNKKWTTIPVTWGRGCNYACEFCTVNGKHRAGGAEKVIRQIDASIKLGYHNFFITDDHVAQNSDKAIEMFTALGDYIKKTKKKISVIVQSRTELAENEELKKAMKYGGVNTICIGYESPIDEELRAMHKGITVKKMVERSRELSKDFYIHGMFIFGYPTFKDSEYKSNLTLEERAKRYEQFFRDAKITTVQVFKAIPLVGSELRKRLDKEGRLIPLDKVGWDKYDGAFLPYDPTPEGINAHELQDIPIKLMERRYSGNALGKILNYGRWIDWTANTLGFPVTFGSSYVKNFVRNLNEKKRVFKGKFMTGKDVFYEPLQKTWKVFKKNWRTTFFNTMGGGIIRKWKSIYRKGDYKPLLSRMYQRKEEQDKRTITKDYIALK